MDLTTWAWLIVPLGVTRAVQIVLWDRITKGPRAWLLERLNPEGYGMGDPRRGYLSYLLECPWCMSIWVGALVTAGLLWDLTRAATLAVLLVLALSLAAVIIDRMVDRWLPDEAPPAAPAEVNVGQVVLGGPQGGEFVQDVGYVGDDPPPEVAQALADLAGADTDELG